MSDPRPFNDLVCHTGLMACVVLVASAKTGDESFIENSEGKRPLEPNSSFEYKWLGRDNMI